MSETNQSDSDRKTPYVETINGRVNFATPTSGGLADVGVTPPPQPGPQRWTSDPPSDPVGAASPAPGSHAIPADPPTVSGAALELAATDSDAALSTDRLVSARRPPRHSVPSPVETIAELKDLSIGYARQETLGPLKELGRWAGYGLGGALLVGLGGFLLAMALLRGLQQVNALDGGWSWVPYLAVTGVLVAAIALTARAMMARPLPRETTSD